MKNMVETTAGPNLVMKAIFAICAFILAIVLLPTGTAHAASYSIPSDAQASGTNGGCSWYITSASDPVNPSQLVIYPTNGTSGTLNETAPNTTKSPWGDYASLPESLYVAEGVTTGTEARYLFSKFSNLKTADVGNLVFGESTRQINGMFYYCSSLQSVNTDGWDLSSITNLDGLFEGCKSLASIDMSKWDTSNMTSFSHLFAWCTSLTTVDLTPLEMEKTKTIASMFSNCTNLQSITGLSGRDMPDLTSLNTIFSGCKSLPSVDVTGLDTGKVTSFTNAFTDCSNLKSIVGLDTWDTGSGTRFYGMFDGCSSIESIDVSNFNTSNAESFELMFADCTNLKSLDLSSFSTTKVTSFYSFLKGCENITSLDLSGFDTSKATDMVRFFYGMNRLSEVTLGASFNFAGSGSTSGTLPTPNPDYIAGATGKWQAVAGGTVSAPKGAVYVSADVPSNVAETYVVEKEKVPILAEWNSWYKGSTAKTDFTTVNIVDSYSPTGSEKESWDASAAQNGSVMAYVSADGKALTLAGNGYGSIIANEVSIGVFESFENVTAFSGLGVLDMSKAKTIQAFFSSCRSVKSLDLSMWNTSNLGAFDGTEGYPTTDMYAVFGGCQALESVNVSGWDVDDVECMSFLFSGCQSLKTVDLSSWDPKSLEKADWVFSGNDSLTSVKGMTGWGSDGKITKVDHLFYNCPVIKSVDLSDWNVSNCVDMNRMFYYDYLLESVCLDGWDTSSCENFNMMFFECPVLNNLDLSGFDTSGADQYGLSNFAYNDFGLDNIILGPDFGTAEQADRGWIFYVNTARSDVADRFPSGYLETTVTGANAIMEFGAYDWAADNRAPRKTEPMLAEKDTWYKGATDKTTLTAINIVDSYTPTGSEKESWDASAEQDGSVMAYVSADGKTLTIAGNGSGYIKANADSSVAFDGFASVTAINGLSLLDTSDVLEMFGFFADNTSLTSVQGIEDWDVSNCTTFAATFSECTSLTSLDLSKWDMSSAESIGDLAFNCVNLVDLKTPTKLAENLTNIYHVFESCEKLESVDVSFMCSGKIEFADCAFQSCSNLKTIVGYETLVTSATKDIAAIFNGCGDIEYLDLSKWVTENVDSLNLTFGYTYGLSTIDGLENWNVGKVTDMTSTFASSAVSNLDGISGWDVSNVKSFNNTFCFATKLTELDLSSWSTDSAEDMSNTFNYCSKLVTLKLGPGFSTENVVDFNGFLTDCRNLKTLDISMIDTSAASDMTDFFTGMDVLQQVTLGEKFSFTGDGSTSCVLPTPDPAYITGAIGKWQAVANGTATKPAGTIYLPADVPSNVHETYVMPITTISVDVPIKVTLAAAADGTWCTPTATANQIINHSLAPVNVVSAKAAASDGFTMLANASVASSTTSNVFGGTIAAGAGAAQDLTAIDTSADAWTMAAATDSDNSDLIGLQLTGSIGNVEGKYFTEAAQLFGITYTFELAL